MKPRPNHKIYIRVLRDMGPEKRLKKAFELSEFSRSLLRQGLRSSNPEAGEAQLDQLYLARMAIARGLGD